MEQREREHTKHTARPVGRPKGLNATGAGAGVESGSHPQTRGDHDLSLLNLLLFLLLSLFSLTQDEVLAALQVVADRKLAASGPGKFNNYNPEITKREWNERRERKREKKDMRHTFCRRVLSRARPALMGPRAGHP